MHIIPAEIQAKRLEKMFSLVRRSRLVNEVLPAIQPTDPDLLALCEAIKQGNLSSDLFRHKMADVYILYLMQHQFIAYEEGVTAYLYVMAFLEYNNDAIYLDHAKAEDKAKIESYPLISANEEGEGVLTELGEKYVNHVLTYFDLFREEPLEREVLVDFICRSRPVEQNLVCIKNISKDYLTDKARSSFEILQDLICFMKLFSLSDLDPSSDDYGDIKNLDLILPPSSLIDFILLKITRRPPEETTLPLYGFGTANQNTMLAFQDEELRLASIHSRFVNSNLTKAHGYEINMFAMLVHDIGHVFSINVLGYERRKLFTDDFIPLFWRFAEEQKKIGKVFNSDFALFIGNTLNDQSYTRGSFNRDLYFFDKIDISTYVYASLKFEMDNGVGEYAVMKKDMLELSTLGGFLLSMEAYLIKHDLLISEEKRDLFKLIWEGLMFCVFDHYKSTTQSPLLYNRCVSLFEARWDEIKTHFSLRDIVVKKALNEPRHANHVAVMFAPQQKEGRPSVADASSTLALSDGAATPSL